MNGRPCPWKTFGRHSVWIHTGELPRLGGAHHAQALIDPELHVHLAVHARRGGEILPRVLKPSDTTVKLPEAEVAMRDEGTHSMRSGDWQSLLVGGGAAFGLEPIRMGFDVAQKPERLSGKAGMTARDFDRAVGKALCLVELIHQKISPAQSAVRPAPMLADLPGRLTLEQFLGFSNPAQ